MTPWSRIFSLRPNAHGQGSDLLAVWKTVKGDLRALVSFLKLWFPGRTDAARLSAARVTARPMPSAENAFPL